MRVLAVLSLALVSSFLHAQSLHFSSVNGTVNTVISQTVIEEAYRRLGVEITVKHYPGDRSLKYSNRGASDGELFRIDYISKVYKNLVKVPVPINQMEGVAFSTNPDIEISGWDSLRKYKVGIRRGIKFSENGTQSMNPYVVNLNQQLISVLLKGKVDLIVLTRGNGLEMIKKFESPSIKAIEPPIQKYNLYHYLHKKNLHLLPKLEKVLKEMAAEGFMAATRKRLLDEILK